MERGFCYFGAMLSRRRRPPLRAPHRLTLGAAPQPDLPLGERAVLWSMAEEARGAGEEPRGSNTGPDVIRYFSGARRRGSEQLLGLKQGSWCAAAASAAAYSVLNDGEKPPHGYRAGVVELVDDAKDNGAWLPIEEVTFADKGSWPARGDLAIYDRSDPEVPESQWWRHVNRIVEIRDDGSFQTLGGNEGNDAWAYAEHQLDEPKLLGFIRYPGGARGPTKKSSGTLVVVGVGVTAAVAAVIWWLRNR